MRDARFAEANELERQNPSSLARLDAERARAAEVANGPVEYERIQNARGAIQGAGPACWNAFHDEFVAQVLRAADRRVAWAEVLRSSIANRCSDVAALAMVRGEEDQLHQANNDWLSEVDPYSVWDHPSAHLHFFPCEGFGDASLLLRIHPQYGFSLLDSMPFPAMMYMALQWGFDVAEDRDLIEELIELAPPVIEAESWAATHSVVALLLIEQVVRHAEKLDAVLAQRVWRSEVFEPPASGVAAKPKAVLEEELRMLESDELPSWFTRGFRAVLRRSDGRAIAVNYMARLARKVLLGQTGEARREWPVFECALKVLATEATRHGVGVAAVRSEWLRVGEVETQKLVASANVHRAQKTARRRKSDSSGEGARTLCGEGFPYLLATAMLFGDTPQPGQNIEPLWSLFEEMLVGRDPGLSLVKHGESLQNVPQRLGFLLSLTDNPGHLFSSTYKKLEPHRRRAQFAYRYEEYEQDLESEVLIRVGLNAAANWAARAQSERQREDARRMFMGIYDAARRLWLTAVMDTDNSKGGLVVLCFAFVKFVHGDSLGSALQVMIPPIANNLRMTCDAAWLLWKNGIAMEALPELFRNTGVDLCATLRDMRQWTELASLPNGFPGSLNELVSALGIESGDA